MMVMVCVLSSAALLLITFVLYLCLRPMTVSWTFDDGLKAHATIVGRMLKKYGWTGAFNVCTDFLDSNPSSLTTEKRKILGLVEHPEARMDWDDARRLLADGHEVYPHGCTHENLEERWKAGEYGLVKHEIRDSIASYREHIGILPRFFCCPHLGWTPEVRELIRAEGVEMFNNWRPGFGGEESAEAVIKELMRLYYEGRRHVDLMFHGIVSREGGYKPFADEDVFERILVAVSDFEKSGKIRVVAYRAAHFWPSRFAKFYDSLEWFEKKIRRFVYFYWYRDLVNSYIKR